MRKLIPRLALACLCFVAIVALWYAWLYSNSRKLIAISDRFPREYTLGSPSNPPLLFVALGDSTSVGTGDATLQQSMVYKVAEHLSAMRHVHVVNFAKVGATYEDVCTTQLSKLAGLKPDVIMVSCGANDATHKTPLAAYRESLDTVVRVLTATTAKKVLLATAPDLEYARAIPRPIQAQYLHQTDAQNETLETAVAGTRIKIVDIFQRGKIKPMSFYAPDLFHPNADGYAVWAKLFIASAG